MHLTIHTTPYRRWLVSHHACITHHAHSVQWYHFGTRDCRKEVNRKKVSGENVTGKTSKARLGFHASKLGDFFLLHFSDILRKQEKVSQNVNRNFSFLYNRVPRAARVFVRSPIAKLFPHDLQWFSLLRYIEFEPLQFYLGSARHYKQQVTHNMNIISIDIE